MKSSHILYCIKVLYSDEWFALISKRDDLLHQAERVSKEKRRVKLEIELVGLRHQANKLAMIDEYRKTQLDYDRENELVVQCMNIVQQKSQLDEEIEEIDEQILLQKELHFKRQQESMDQKAKGLYGPYRNGIMMFII